jgi:cysteine desulfurase
MREIFLDNNATTQPAPEVVNAMCNALEEVWYNPSSVYRSGQAARHVLEEARAQVCALVGCGEREMVFTSCATESVALVTRGSFEAQPRKKVLVTSRMEHSAVRQSAETFSKRGVEVVWLPNDNRGIVDVEALRGVIKTRADEIALVSIMWANNETGVVQPVKEIGDICRSAGVRFHCDGTQWVGKEPTNVAEMPIDFLSFSAHKFYGPKGIGGLYVRRGLRLEPQVIGGGQERDHRGGTENVPGAVGMAAAAKLVIEWLKTSARDEMRGRRDDFEKKVAGVVGDCMIVGEGAPRVWNTTNIAFARLEAEVILLALSERGVCASAGSACSSGSLEASPVIQAMHVPNDYAHGAVRFSLSRDTTTQELEQAAEIVQAVIGRVRETAPVA